MRTEYSHTLYLYFGMVALAQTELIHFSDPPHSNASATNTTTTSLLKTHDIRGIPSARKHPWCILL